VTRAERQVRGRGRWLAVAATVLAASLTSCSEDGGTVGSRTDAAGAETATTSPTGPRSTTPPRGSRETILIKTRITGFSGEVLAGSLIGDSPFCPGGTVGHEHGSPEIGYPAVNVFHCTGGQVRIGFGPGPDQMNDIVQTSGWEILDGSGGFAGITGLGQMKVRWARVGASRGRETFRGEGLIPRRLLRHHRR